jgi:3-isopropylmalate dehydrogenase
VAEIRAVVLPGDGVGPEVCSAATLVLNALAERFGHTAILEECEIGYTAWENTGTSLSERTLAAWPPVTPVGVGGGGEPAADRLPPAERPEAALLRLRAELGCFANLRPASVDKSLVDASPLRSELAARCDLVVVRELTGGVYYGTPRYLDASTGRACNTLSYTTMEIERIARVAFEEARRRRRHVTSVDKANVLEVSRLWRDVVQRTASDYPDVELDHMLVDRAAMELVLNPGRFDVLLTENMFGDILSDGAGAVCGSLGVLGSASIGGKTGLFEPVHGSAPDIAGRGVANPIGAIHSVALMLEHAFGMGEETHALEGAVSRVLAQGMRTPDISRNGRPAVGTADFARAVAEALP